MKYITLTANVYRLALMIIFFSSLAFYFTLEHFWFLLLNNVIIGVGMSLVLPYVETTALTLMPKEKYGKVRLFGSIGFILVSLVLVKFLDKSVNAIHFLSFAALFTLIFGLVIYRFEKKENLPQTQNESFNLLSHWSLWVSLFLMQVSFAGFYNFFTIYVSAYDIGIEALNISAMDMTIYLWSFGVICEIIMLYFQAPLLNNPLLKILQFSILLTALRWFILALFPENIIMLFLSQSIHAFSFALYHSAAIMYLHTLYSNRRLSQQFFAGIAYGLGAFVGAFASGFIFEISASLLYLLAGVIALLSLLFLSFKRRNTIA